MPGTPGIEIEKLTPMMRQYLSIKQSHKNHIVFFRLGDFYEMFFEDAQEISQVLGLALTGRDCGLSSRAPMCGIPHHAIEGYLARLVKAGYKVAICEQTEDPAFAKGVVSREVVRVVTPGTLMEDNLLEEDTNNFLCSIYYGSGGYGLAVADISTGQVNLIEIDREDDGAVINQLAGYSPREVIFNPAFVDKAGIAKFMREKLGCTADLLDQEIYDAGKAEAAVLAHFKKDSLAGLGISDKPRCLLALAGLLYYLAETQKVGLERLCSVAVHQDSKYMQLSERCRDNLELLKTGRAGEKKGSLLWVLDKTKTPMGKRLIKTFISRPLISPAEIDKRLNASEELYSSEMKLAAIQELLAQVSDLERLITRVVYGSATPRDILGLGRSLKYAPLLKDKLAGVKSDMLCALRDEIDPLEDLSDLIERALTDQPPATLKAGGVIRDDYSPALKELRELMSGSKEILTEMERAERERTGIKNLKISFNKVFGYFIEVSKSNLSLVPEDYIRKQTVSTGERYITGALKELEGRILAAGEQAAALEAELFETLRVAIAKELHRIQRTAGAVAKLDVFCSFARVSLDNRYVRPVLSLDNQILISDGRHPVVELMLGGQPFVPNDALLDCGENQIAIITGPNMAGKSTYMRQTALIVLMAQIGCFVPASSAKIGVVDGIFTRIGASDDLSAGQSTFMVEMLELAEILRTASAKSLLILDEIGRGTSTYDGMSIARAALEYIAQKGRLGAKTMFATHYQELAEVEDVLDVVKNYNVAVKKRGEEITFLRKIVRGAADRSYGVEVGKLAGIPDPIIKRAYEILKDLESAQPVRTKGKKRQVEDDGDFQIHIESLCESRVEEALREISPDTLTPIEALNELFKLREMLGK
ncbi:MAG: DNA mismatch repair protein MutS [Oscillospiraceae bacterium]|nr:DNA mismatch repair protein MutS [Oscillospiraceae bacterium]